jgi:hypothetical protein
MEDQVPDGESLWDRIEGQAGIAPVMGDPKPVAPPAPWEVSQMAGWGSGGYDTLDGVDRMVLGEADANRELRVDSATEGGPLEIADGESVYDDRHGTGIMSMSMGPKEDPANFDWCAYL